VNLTGLCRSVEFRAPPSFEHEDEHDLGTSCRFLVEQGVGLVQRTDS